MNPEEFDQLVEEQFHRGLAVPESGRAEFLTGISEQQVRSRVGALLQAAREAPEQFVPTHGLNLGDVLRRFTPKELDGIESTHSGPPEDSVSENRSTVDIASIPATVGKYSVVRPLGKGGQAVTLLAKDTTLDRLVVVKRYHQAGSGAEEYIRKEGRALAQLNSPFVAKCYSMEQHDGQFYLVMEYIRGEELDSYVRRQGLDLRAMAALVGRVAEGLVDVHDAGLLHRDIKPANILVRPNGTPCLVDFGIAAPLRSDSLETIAGTLAYMSPEQANQDVESVGPASDVFGLGAVLYKLITNQPPYQGHSTIEIWERARRADYRPLRALRPDVPTELETICAKAMTSTLSGRYRSADALRQDLFRFVGVTAAQDAAGAERRTDKLGINPYKGLDAFGEEDADQFFGREDIVSAALQRIKQFASGAVNFRFLAIVGASGSGKSSLAHAGILAGIKRGSITSAADWPIVVCRPGHEPLEGLAVALAANSTTKTAAGDVCELIDRLQQDSRRLHVTARLALEGKPAEQRIVVLVDQFEEIFQAGDEQLKLSIIRNLLHAAHAPDGKTIVLLTMRADFYAKASLYPDLAAALSSHQILVGPLSEGQLRTAIERPANLAGAEFEPGLVEMLVQDMRTGIGALPFLQVALRQLWDRRKGELLSIDDYNSIGRLAGAIQSRAEEVFEKLSSEDQLVCRSVFMRLVQPGEGTEDTKRRSSWNEVSSTPAAARVVQTLVTARLLTATTELTNESCVEIAHEALIRGWSRLRQWIEEGREGLMMQHRLTEAARDWEGGSFNEAFLYRGARLELAEEWLKSNQRELIPLERQFLDASVRQRELELKQRNLVTTRLRRRAWAAAASAMLAMTLALIAMVLASWHRKASEEADRKSHYANAQRLVVEAQEMLQENPELGLARASQAVKEVLNSSPKSFDQKSSDAPMKSMKAAVERLERRDKWLVLGGLNPRLAKPLLSPDGNWLVSQTLDRRFFLWNLSTTGIEPIRLRGPNGIIQAIDISPNSRWLVILGNDSRVRLHDLSNAHSGANLFELRGHELAVEFAGFSRNSRWLATCDGAAVRIWDLNANDVRTSSATLPIWNSPTGIDARMSRSGRWLTTRTANGVQLWDMDLSSQESPIVDVSGTALRLPEDSSNDYEVFYESSSLERLASSATGSISTPVRRAGKVASAFSPNDRWFALIQRTASSPGAQLRVLDLMARSPVDDPIVFEVGDEFRFRTVFSPDERWLFAADYRKQYLWNLDEELAKHKEKGEDRSRNDKNESALPRPIGQGTKKDTAALPFGQEFALLRCAVFCPHSRWLFVGMSSQSFLLDLSRRDADGRRWIQSLNNQIGTTTLGAVASFSPDARWMTLNTSRGLKIGELKENGEQPLFRPLSGQGGQYSIAYSADADCRWLLTISDDRGALLWDSHSDPPFSAATEIRLETFLQEMFFRGTAGDQQILGVNDWGVSIWALANGQEFKLQSNLKAPPAPSRTSDIDPSGEWYVATEGRSLELARMDPSGLSHSMVRLEGHSAPIQQVIVGPAKKWMASVAENGEVFAWRLESQLHSTVPIRLTAPKTRVTALTVAPNDGWLIAAFLDGAIAGWNLDDVDRSTEPIVDAKHEQPVFAMAVDPDSRWLVTRGIDRQSWLWSLERPLSAPVAWRDSFAVGRASEAYAETRQANSTNHSGSAESRAGGLVVKDDWTTRLWNVRLGNLVGQFDPATTSDVSAAKRLLDATAASAVQLTKDGSQPSFSTNGTQMVFVTTKGGCDVLQLDNGTRTNVVGSGREPSWQPGPGKFIAFVEGDTTAPSVWIYDVLRRERRFVDEGGHPHWSGNGQTLFYFSRKRQQLMSMDLEAIPLRPQVAVEQKLGDSNASISPDGKLIAVQKGNDLLIQNMAGEVQLLWPIPGIRASLKAWSPDCQRLAFGGRAHGDCMGLWVLDVAAKMIRFVAYGDFTHPSWSPDGRELAFAYCPGGETNEVWKIANSSLETLSSSAAPLTANQALDIHSEVLKRVKVRTATARRAAREVYVDLARLLAEEGQLAQSLDAYRAILASETLLEGLSYSEKSPIASQLGQLSPRLDRQSAREALMLAIRLHEPLAMSTNDSAYAFTMGNICARLGDLAETTYERQRYHDQSLNWLIKSSSLGFAVLDRLRNDPYLRGLSDHPRVKQWLADDPVNVLLEYGAYPQVNNERKVITLEIDGAREQVPRSLPDLIAWLNRLSDLKSLTLLGIEDCETILSAATEIAGLETLILSGSQITDTTLKSLYKFNNLRVLNLTHTAISDAGLIDVSRMPNLQMLWLSHTQVSDEGLRHLAQARNLQRLYVEHTGISDAGLAQLATLRKLKFLGVGGCRVSEGGIGSLTKAVPGLAVHSTERIIQNVRSHSTKVCKAAVHALDADMEPGFLVARALSHSDRSFRYIPMASVGIPKTLLNAEYIRTANDQKQWSRDFTLEFDLTRPADLYLFIDDRVNEPARGADATMGVKAGIMQWVFDMGFTDTGTDIRLGELEERNMSIYVLKNAQPKHYMLREQQRSLSNMYGVAAVPSK